MLTAQSIPRDNRRRPLSVPWRCLTHVPDVHAHPACPTAAAVSCTTWWCSCTCSWLGSRSPSFSLCGPRRQRSDFMPFAPLTGGCGVLVAASRGVVSALLLLCRSTYDPLWCVTSSATRARGRILEISFWKSIFGNLFWFLKITHCRIRHGYAADVHHSPRAVLNSRTLST